MPSTQIQASPAIAARIYDYYTHEVPDALARDLQLNERATTKTIEIVGELGELTAPYPPARQFLAPEHLQRVLRDLGS